MATASSPAFTAPDAPIATVATGTPFGICTMDSSESRPLSATLCTGTPMTGRIGLRRDHSREMSRTARAGDDHFEPALDGRGRIFRLGCGSPVRRHDFALVGDVKMLEDFVRVTHGVPVGLAAHDHPNQGTRLGHAVLFERVTKRHSKMTV